jgi:hypothetical protein
VSTGAVMASEVTMGDQQQISRKRRLTISLEAEDYAALQALAARRDRSLSWLICRAVKDHLERQDPDELISEPQAPLGL